MTAIAYDNFVRIPKTVIHALYEAGTLSEVKAALYLCERTYGHNKQADRISLSQFLNGITKADGTRLDSGCGVKSKSSLVNGLKRLKERAVCMVSSMRDHMEAPLYTMPVRPVPPKPNEGGMTSVPPGPQSEPEGVRPLQNGGTDPVPTIDSNNRYLNNSLLESPVGTGGAPPEQKPPENEKSKGKGKKGKTPKEVRDYIQRALVKQAELYTAGDMSGAREMGQKIEKARDVLAKLEGRERLASIRERIKNSPIAAEPKPDNSQGPQRINPDSIFGRMRRAFGGPQVPERQSDPERASEAVRAEIKARDDAMTPEQREKAAGLFNGLMSRIKPLDKKRLDARGQADALVAGCEEAKRQAPKEAYARYLSMNPLEMVRALYKEHIDNPRPHVDEHNVKSMVAQVERMSQAEKIAVVDAFVRASSGKVKPRSLRPVELNLWKVD